MLGSFARCFVKKKAAIISTFRVSILLGSLLTLLAFAVQQDDIIILSETMVIVKSHTVYQNKVTAWVIARCDNSTIIRSLKQERKIIMKWKSMPLSHKIATIIAGLAVVVWLIHQVKPTLFPVDPTYPPSRWSRSAKPWSTGRISASGPVF